MSTTPVDPRELSGLDPKAVAKLLELKKKPIVPADRRDTTKYPDMVTEEGMRVLVPIVGEIAFAAGRAIETLLTEYQKKWRMADYEVIEAIHAMAETALTKPGVPEILNAENQKTFDTFRAMQDEFRARFSEAKLLDDKTAGELVADMVHNQFAMKEKEISDSQERRLR